MRAAMPPGEPKKTPEEAEAAAKALAGTSHEPLEDLERKFYSGEVPAAFSSMQQIRNVPVFFFESRSGDDFFCFRIKSIFH